MKRWPVAVAVLGSVWLVAGRGWVVAMAAAVAAAMWLTRGDTQPAARAARVNLARVMGPAWVRACAYCGDRADGWDHLVPLSRGGNDRASNLVSCCRRCNSSKNDSTPEEWWQRIGAGATYPDHWPRTRGAA